MNNFLALSLIIQINLARITNNDPECEVFKNKIGSGNNDQNNSIALGMGGIVSFEPETANLEIQLHYYDQYFFDPKFKGLTKEDGIDNELTCLDLKLLKFSDKTFDVATQQEITDLKPVPSSNESTRQRYLTYTIPGEQLKTRLIESESTTKFVYTGYYAVAYYIETQVQFTYEFQFSVTVNKVTIATLDTRFFYFSYMEILQCKAGASCTANPSSSIEFCTNSTCVETTKNSRIYMNENFWLIQKITTDGLNQYYLSETEIRFVGEGLNKPATIDAVNYTVPGQAIYRIKATFAWTKLSIQVSSVLKTTAPTRILLADTETTQKIHGESDQICILIRNGTECPTCDEMIANNPDGDAPKECDSANMFLLIGLALFSFSF